MGWFDFMKKKRHDEGRARKSSKAPHPAGRAKSLFLPLEQRLMFDAAAAATTAEVASEQVAQEQAEAALSADAEESGPGTGPTGSEDLVQALTTFLPTDSPSEMAFVDPTVPNYQELLSGLDPNIEVIMLDGGSDGIEQIANALAGRTGIDALHFIGHGDQGLLNLGTARLTAESMSGQYAAELATIQQALSEQADILVYGCDFAAGDEGLAAVAGLAELTGADVAASSDQTGHIDLGGDWEFEVQAGSIETDSALTDAAQMNWMGLLGIETVSDTFSSESYSNNNGTQSWSTSWSETDASGGGASGGDVRVNSSQLRIDTDTVGNAISRGVNLSGATSATLTFDYTNALLGADRIEVRVSTDGGTNYQALTGGTFSSAGNTGSGTASLDLSSYMSANTRIQFIVTATGGGERLYVDNVQVSYQTNNAPVLSDTALTLTVVEDAGAPSGAVGSLISSFIGGITDADSGASAGIAITDTNETNGTWYYTTNGGSTWTAVGSVSNTSALLLADNGSTRLYFAPSADYNGTSSAALTVRAWDQTSGTAGTKVTTASNGGTTAFSSATDTIDVTVSAVNDAPTDLSLSGNSVAENAANGTVVGTVTGTGPDTGDTQTYSFTDSAGGRFAIQSSTGVITVADGSLLDYESATSHNVTVRVTDSGGLTYDETFTINLTNVNEGPTGADATITLAEDTTHTLTTANFGFSDVDAGDSLSAVRIDTVPSAGSLTLSGVAVTAGQVIAVADITAGNLVFTPAADATGTGYASVTFSVRDSNGTYDAVPNTLTVDVTTQNDAPTFRIGDGQALTSFGSGWEFGRETVIQPDGKILVGGYSDSGGSDDFSLVRYNADGTLDTSFGGGDGMAFAGIVGRAETMVLQADGKVVLSGYTTTGGYQVCLVRFNADGTLDTSFGGGDGIASSGVYGSAKDVALQTDGKFLVAADLSNSNFNLMRFNSDGSLDTSFGGGSGYVSTDLAGSTDRADSLTIQSDGKVLLSGFGFNGTSFDFALVRYNTDGSLDTSFNGTGKALTDFVANSSDMGNEVRMQADGKIVVAGWSNAGGTNDFAIARYNTNGTLDTGFGTGGKVTINLGGSDLAEGLTIQSDGKILVTGTAGINGGDVGLVRLNTDGSLDTTFGGGDGIVTTDYSGASDDRGYSVAVQNDGRIVVSGTTQVGGLGGYNVALNRYSSTGSLDTTLDPVNTLNGTPTYTEGGSPVVLDADVQIFDAELSALNNFNGATLTLARNGGANAEDQLVFDGAVVTVSGPAVSVSGVQVGTYTFTGGEMTIALNGNATQALVNSLMQHILYYNVSDTPPATAQIDWAFSDGNTGAQGTGGAMQATGSTTVTIIAVNDAPVVTPIAPDVTFVESGLAQVIDATGTITDVDSSNFDGGVMTVSISANGTADDRLMVGNWGTGPGQVGVSGSDVTYGGTVIGTVSGGTSGSDPLVITFNTSATPTAVQEVYRSIQFNNVSDNPSTATRTLTIGLTDGDGGTATSQTKLVYVQGTNDAPVLTDTALALTVSEDAGAPSGTVGNLLSAFTGGITDADSGASKGIAITGTDETNGTWYYTTDGGSTWTAVGSVSNTSALLLADNGSTRLYFAPSADYNGTSTAALTLRAWDQTSGTAGTKVTTASNGGTTAFSSATDTIDVTVSAVNDTPTDLSLSAGTVAENAGNGTVVGTVSGTDPDTGDTKTYSLTDTAGGRFAINSSTGQITVADGSLLNYEIATSHNVTVRVTDSGGLTYDETFTITVTNENEAPTGADATITLAEDTTHTLTTANFGFSDVDAGDSLSAVRIDTVPSAGTLNLSGVNVTAGQVIALADITSGKLMFRPATDANGTGYTSFTFSVRDSTSTYDSAPNVLTINVTAVNDAPVMATNDGLTVSEAGSVVVSPKFLSVTDVDNRASELTFMVTTLPVNGTLLLNRVPLSLKDTFTQADIDREMLEYVHDGSETTVDSFAFVVEDGSGGAIAESTFKISITPINDTPTDLSLSANTVTENASNGTVVGTITGTDPDTGDTKTYSFTDSAGGRFAIQSSTGVITVADGSLLDYESATSHNVTVRVTDSGGLTYDETFTINLTNVNEGPTFSNLNGAPTYVEGGAAVVLDSDVQITDPELSSSNNFSGATLTLQRQGGTNSQDIFSAAGTLSPLIDEGALVVNGITIGGVLQNAGGTLILVFNGNATGALVNAAMQQIAYSNSSDAPPNSAQVNWTFSDGNSGTQGTGGALGATGSTTVTITAVNDTPTDLSLSAGTVAENAGNGTVVGTVSGTDPDTGDTKTYSLTDTAGGRFAINSSIGQITVADGSLLNYEIATSHNVTVRVTDSGGLTYDETFTITVTNENEAPTGADATITLAEDTTHTLTTANFGFSDVDAGDSLSAVRIDTVPSAGSLTLSGVAVTAGQVITVADITAGNLVFTPAADANGTGYAGFTFSVRDSNNTYDAAPNTLTFDVTPVNDAPILTAGSVNNLSVSEDAGLVSLGLGSVTYSPGGGADESGQTLTYAVTALPSGTIGNVYLADGTTLVTPSSYTLAEIQGMQFQPTANASGVTAFQFNVYDSGGTANGGANTISQFILITVSAVNDAPTITSLSGDSLSYSEGDGAVVIEQGVNALVADVDSANLDTGTLTVSIPSGGDSAEDVLSIRNQGTGAGQIGVSGSNVTYQGVTIGTFTGGSGDSNLVITLTASATPTAVTALVKNITYENTDATAPTTGARTVRYVLTDGDGGTSANYDTTVTVTAVDDPTVVTGGTSGTGNEDTTLTNTLTATDVEGLTDGTVFTVSANATNGTASIDPATGLWSYTPNADYNGSDSFTVTITDDAGTSSTQVISVTVTPVVDITNDSLTTAEETAISANVLTGSNGATADSFDGTPVLTSVTQGTNGSVTFLADGTVTYTPTANFTGTDSFTYTITSGGVTETATVTVTVTAVDDPTVVTGGTSGTGNEDTTLTNTLTATDVEGLTDGTAFTVSANATNGTASIDPATGLWSYTPNADYNGSDSFTVTITDDAGTSSTQVISVTVTPVNDAPTLMANTGSTAAEGGTDTIDSSELAVADVDNSAAQLTYSIGTGPTYGRLELTTAPGISATTFTQADIAA
ncbi:MAG: tandem-95 repeat protein, partial [Nitrospira sp. CR2.1]|nr:tandem-95 repeat protein [Nitrospira sp. CR2.1]